MNLGAPEGAVLALVGAAALAGAAVLSGRERGSTNAQHRWMSLGAALAAEPAAKKAGASKVARSDRGFMRAYEEAGGDPAAMAELFSEPSGQRWDRRRHGFVARHKAQVDRRGEALWRLGRDGSEQPSRRHLAMMMWAYTPTPEITERWLREQGYEGAMWA